MSSLPSETSPDSLSAEIRKLGHILGEIIVKLEGKDIFDLEERIRRLAKSSRGGDTNAEADLLAAVKQLSVAEAGHVAMAFTVYFELVNLAEETHRVRLLRQRRRIQYQTNGTPMRESIGAALRDFKARNVPAETVQTILNKLSIELVFTAHPTESKRRTMLNKLQRLSHRLQNPGALIEDEITGIENPRALEREITALWLTDRSRSARPEVTDEVRTGLWYFDTTLWETVPLLQDELERALADTYPTVKAPTRWIRFGSWMGGDRDGNPNVTPAVTSEAMMLHRKLALDKLQRSLRSLSQQISVSSRLDGISPALLKAMDTGASLDLNAGALRERYPHEPYRLALIGLRSRVLEAEKTEKPAALLEPATGPTSFLKSSEVAELLDLISESLSSHRAGLLTEGELHRLRQQVTLFGLSVARLDVRQHSMRHETAMTEILKAVDVTPDYAALTEEEKLALMAKVLAAPAPALPDNFTKETADVIGSLRVLKRAIELFGEEAVGVYVISMTHDLSDIIEVMVFQHLVGVSLDIAPLFETLGDLEAAPGILNQMFDFAPYWAHLQSRPRAPADHARLQRQQQGLRLPHGQLGALPGAGGNLRRLQAARARPDALPRTRWQHRTRRRPGGQGDPGATVRLLRREDPRDRAGRSALDPLPRSRPRLPHHRADGLRRPARGGGGAEGCRRARGMAHGDDRDVEDGLCRLRGAGAQGPGIHRVLENGHADRGNQRAEARLAPHVPPRDQVGRGPARHPLGLLVDAEPVCLPGLVRSRQRARAIRRQGR